MFVLVHCYSVIYLTLYFILERYLGRNALPPCESQARECATLGATRTDEIAHAAAYL